jgi:hypothetical protein
MGGQACILYGAAEFSRDTDLAVLASPANFTRLRRALDDLQAQVIAVPPFEATYLRRGHAVHFRCQHPEALGMRVDIMTRMRGVESFPKLWARRNSIELPDGTCCNVMSLPDLVQAKKTQRDKDWPMVRRLIEADYFHTLGHPSHVSYRPLLFFQYLEISQERRPLFIIVKKVRSARGCGSVGAKKLCFLRLFGNSQDKSRVDYHSVTSLSGSP